MPATTRRDRQAATSEGDGSPTESLALAAGDEVVHAAEHARRQRLEAYARELHRARPSRQAALPDKRRSAAFVDGLLDLLFPVASPDVHPSPDAVRDALGSLAIELRACLRPLERALPETPAALVAEFFDRLPAVHRRVRADAEAICEGDPAARSVEEVVLAYPGFQAIAFYRIAHELHLLGVPLLPRILTEAAHQRTGIDIHPGARLGSPVVIDHGTGIVIGETAVVGDRVKLYQGVTLGALSVAKSAAGSKRHPTIEDDVVIYANATILGGETVIGAGSVIGGNVWLTESVPPRSVVYHRSEVHVRTGRAGLDPLDFVI
ncbi:MAG TPA: serine O-acetyltransferase EpsC [Candidatus Limnocylindrales bacterium]